MIPDLLRRAAGANKVEIDPYFSSVSLLLHMDGTNASTSFVDSGPNALAVTASGNAQISTAQSKFGGAAGSFPSASSSSVAISSSTLFNFGSSNFTVECWVYWNGGGGNPGAIFTTAYPTDSQGVFLGTQTDGKIQYLVGNGSWAFTGLSTSAISSGVWTHVALVRNGSTFTVYINGVSSGSNTSSSSLTNSNNQCLVGGRNVFGQYFNGYIDDLRVTTVARYTSNFTPRAKAFPDNYNPYKTLPTSGAALWLAGDDSSTLFTDAGVTPVKVNGDLVYQWNDKSGNSRNATQTTSGNRPTWVPPASGRNGLGALAFNGSQWLTVASPNANFGTSDFTIEMWIKSNDIASLKTPIGTLTSGSDGGWQVVQSSSRFGFGIGVGGGIETYGSTITADTWYHFAICRSGTTLRIFYNGVVASTITNSSNISQTGSMNVGWSNEAAQTGRRFNGQIQNLLIYKGQALYTANFTPWMS